MGSGRRRERVARHTLTHGLSPIPPIPSLSALSLSPHTKWNTCCMGAHLNSRLSPSVILSHCPSRRLAPVSPPSLSPSSPFHFITLNSPRIDPLVSARLAMFSTCGRRLACHCFPLYLVSHENVSSCLSSLWCSRPLYHTHTERRVSILYRLPPVRLSFVYFVW